jgi:1-acyl-sn-glycerol-3-phosphate acyltransferase
MNVPYQIGWLLSANTLDTLFGLECRGCHHLPPSGPVLVAANHRSFLDPPAVGTCARRPLHYFARESLFRGIGRTILPRVNALPVNNKGPGDLAAIRKALQALRAGAALLVFPEGTRSPTDDFLPARRGVGLLACRAEAPVVPVRLFGTHEALGKHQARPRLRTPLTVVFGPPLEPADYDPGPSGATDRYQLAADRILQAIQELSR